MRKLVFIAVLLMLCGCGVGKVQVVDNVYSPIGFGAAKVDDSFHYYAGGKFHGTATVTKGSFVGRSTYTESQAAVFAKTREGKLDEAVIFVREELLGYSSNSWEKIMDADYEFGGWEYSVRYFHMKKPKGKIPTMFYRFLRNQGVNMKIPGIVGRVMTRKLNKKLLLRIYMVVNLDRIPVLDKLGESLELYLRNRFEAAVTAVD